MSKRVKTIKHLEVEIEYYSKLIGRCKREILDAYKWTRHLHKRPKTIFNRAVAGTRDERKYYIHKRQILKRQLALLLKEQEEMHYAGDI